MPNGLMGVDLATRRSLLEAAGIGEPSDRQLLEQFHRHQDERAFTALVRRHGAMVLGVCQRVLEHAQDAEDAFQATFLVLVRRAGEIGKPELLCNWLYGVAFRIARKTRAQAARRRAHERQAAAMALPEPLVDIAWNEVRGILDQELQALPEKYRAPLVLCYLEGLTNQEAARRLGWPSGSMSARLARGRELLRRRLESRQSALPAGLLVPLLMQKGIAVLPAPLVDSTVQAAVALAGGKTATLAATVQELLDQTLRGGKAKRRTLADMVFLLLLGVVAFLLALTYNAWTGPVKGAGANTGAPASCDPKK